MPVGERRFGHPRTDAERKKRHKARFGTSKLPPRGTGLGINNMQRKSTKGSPEMTNAELMRGYKSLGKGFTQPMDGKAHGGDNRGEGSA